MAVVCCDHFKVELPRDAHKPGDNLFIRREKMVLKLNVIIFTAEYVDKLRGGFEGFFVVGIKKILRCNAVYAAAESDYAL